MKRVKKNLKNRIIITVMVLLLAMSGCLSVLSVQNAYAEDNSPTIVISCSDFQDYNNYTSAKSNVKNILTRIYDSGYSAIDGFLFAGDYTVELNYTETTSAKGLNMLKTELEAVYGSQIDKVFCQGNHDSAIGTAGMSQSGNNDSENYGVFVINEDDYMWYGSDENRIKNTASNLQTYLNAKRNEEYSKPIFVISHLPLHYSMRTYNDGDCRYANYLFDVLNDAGEAGLNIIYLYGHDHSNGWDDYLGGSNVYLSKGSSINIAQANQYRYESETLAFTYMNAGFIGYYSAVNAGADSTLTMSVFTITDDQVKIERYDENGLHNLKSTGVANSYKKESDYVSYTPVTTVVPSPQTILLNKDITPADNESEPEEPEENGSIYQRITSVDQIQDGDQILMIYNGTHFMEPSVVTKGGNSGDRTGFSLESLNDTLILGDQIQGEFNDHEWTFEQPSGITDSSKWMFGLKNTSGAMTYASLTRENTSSVTATLEGSGDTFTLAEGSTSGTFTFTSDKESNVLNYNSSRNLINGYSRNPASFILYRLTQRESVSAEPLKIETQPSDYSGRIGDTAQFTVVASGEGLTYQWYYSKNGEKWYVSGVEGANTDTLNIRITESRIGQMYKCLVTDASSETETSEAAAIVKDSACAAIVTQPSNQCGNIGDTVIFKLNASGEGLTYQWYYSKDGERWGKSGMSGNKTDSLTVPVTMARYGQIYKCIVIDASGYSVTSDIVSIKQTSVQISEQPKSVENGVLNKTYEFTVTASGKGLTYQWYYSKNNGEKWYKSSLEGYNTDTIKVKLITSRVGQQYRCVITDGEGNEVISESAMFCLDS